MDIRECYEKMGASYDDVLQRMGSDALVERFTGSFLSDGSYQMIADGIEAKDAETAFRGAHTLKGVCLNLGFQTEALRDRELKGYEEQFAAVQKQYQITVEAIREWQQEQN